MSVSVSLYYIMTFHDRGCTPLYHVMAPTKNILVYTSTYQYVPALFKKSANRSRTSNLVHKSPRVYPCAIGLQTLMPVKVRNKVSVYIIWFCQTPCQCNWRLMTNRRCRSRPAAGPSHDIPRARPSLDVDLVEA